MKIGFALLTHCKPNQILRLTRTLRRMFPDCMLVCHHDFSLEPNVQTEHFEDVHFVEDFVKTSWGHSSVIEGALKAFRILCHGQDPPQWYYLLSGADYPIKPAEKIISELAASTANVFIRHEKIVPRAYERPWQKKCFRRYFQRTASRFSIRRLLSTDDAKFVPDLQCFAGEHWFTADLAAVRHLLDFFDHHPALLQHYQHREKSGKRIHPDESYYQTVFCNDPDLRIENNCLRYTDWTMGGWHPKTLTRDDLPRIWGSNAHFARKLDLELDEGLFEELERVCAIGQLYKEGPR